MLCHKFTGKERDSESGLDNLNLRYSPEQIQPISALAAGVFPLQNQKGSDSKIGALVRLLPAATYVPTQLPAQYHRPNEA